MSEIADRGSIYDRIIDEKWSTTPDMGEYMNSSIFLNNLQGMSESNGTSIGPEFYVENPIITTPGYNDNLKVIAFNVDNKSIVSEHMNDASTARNSYDGDTVYLDLTQVKDTVKSFQVYYDTETVFKGVKDYLEQTLKLDQDNNYFGLRLLGINAPEVIHYSDMTTAYDESDVYTTTFEQLTNNNTYVEMKKGLVKEQVNINNVKYRPFVESTETVDGVQTVSYKERDPNEKITFIKVRYSKAQYPNMTGDERDVFHEYVETISDGMEVTDEVTGENSLKKIKVKRVVLYCDEEIRKGGVEYANQSKKAQAIVKDAFSKASEVMIMVDAVGLNGVKSEIPEAYKKSYESSKNNPFYVLWDMWKTIVGAKYAYRYASYQVPGVEANGRFLAAIYAKVVHNGVSQWINVNKKVLYECSLAEARPAYSDSADSIYNNNYLSNAFKLWTYSLGSQLYLDGVSEELYKSKDDRAEIQQKLCGVNLGEMTDHTVMIGDCLFMIPPTSIKITSQTKSSKTHLIRAKGSVQKQLPKTERIIQLDLYFNGAEGINGIPIERTLPNGSTKTYYMNGLRSLIAQFKLAPFMPIHNTYINEVLGIDAVSLASYSVNTIPNYPRTLQVTLMMYEFAWYQYMPSQAVPLTDGDNLYKNGFSETIHFPLLRYYYQQALERGSNLVSGSYADLEPNDTRYIAATIGNKTALQPIKFMSPTFDLYIPDEELLKEKKQLKIAMQTRPLGQVFSFNSTQESFISKMYYMNKMVGEIKEKMEIYIPPLTNVADADTNVYLTPAINKAYYSYTNAIGPVIEHNKKGKTVKSMKDLRETYLDVLNTELLSIYKNYRKELGDIIKKVQLVHRSHKESTIYYYKIGFRIDFNLSFFDNEDDFDEIKRYCTKYSGDGLTYTSLFNDDSFQVSYTAEFGTPDINPYYLMTKPLSLNSTDNLLAIRFLASFSDENKDGTQNFKMDEVLDNLKESMDVEDEDSIKFNKFKLSDNAPIITSMVSSYNNIFANVGLKAIDGHAAQFTGGSDSTLDIEMIGDEEVVSTLNTLHRKCVEYLIDYRKVLLSSPLRIDSEFTRLLGLYEMTIESIQTNTIPEYPGKYTIQLRLNSVDRTLRNRESLNKIQDIDNSQMQWNSVAQTKSFFDLKQALGKAELYPDLELPTITELEQAGFYFLKSKFQPERTYPDPDFYFLYWYPTVAENIRTTITEYFSEPSNFNYSLTGDLFKDTMNLQIKASNGNGQSFYEVRNWDDKNTTYEDMVEDLQKLSISISEDGKELDASTKKEVAEIVVGKMQELDDLNSKIMTLQEALDLSTYNTYMVNSLTNVTVKDYEVLDASSESTKKEIKSINKKIKKIIVEELKNPIERKSQSANSHYDYSYVHKKYDTFTTIDKKDFLVKLFQAILNTDKNLNGINYKYISTIIKAAAIGASAKQPFYSSSKPYKNSKDNLCIPQEKISITGEDGKTKEVPRCYYPADNGEILVAHNEDTREAGIMFGDFEIKKYEGTQISQLFKLSSASDGFLDPYYNKDLHSLMFKEDMTDDLDERLKEYREGLLADRRYGQEAHFRQMLVWLYVLLNEETYLGQTIYYASKMLSVVQQWYKNKADAQSSNSLTDGQTNYLVNLIIEDVLEEEVDANDEDNSVSVTYNVTNEALKNYKEEIDAIFGEGSQQNLVDSIEQQQETLNALFESIVEQANEYIPTLIHGLMFSLSAITMSGLTSLILGVVRQGSLNEYKNIIDIALSANSLNELTEEQKRMVRFAQYACYYLDEEKRHIKTDYQKISYNNKIQRAYLAAANDPSLYMLHSYYDMVINDKRGSMARAFPTYYMLLIDEGRTIGYWKLQDNFYNMNSISEFEVVKSRKIAADTARIVMSNMYGVFNADDEDMKDENEYTMRDVWDSVFSPRTYFQKEYDRRENARDINYAKMQPGARVHLRMGYSSNAAELPIVFNGSVAEFENGELMTLVCQGDGVELANPHMFNALDVSDVEDIKYSDAFFGFKQFLETWNSLSTPRSMLVTPLSAEGTWIQNFIKKWSSGRFFNSNPFGIVHFGDKRYTDIFTTDGEVEQNIYEGLSTPTWDYKKCNMSDVKTKGLSEEYGMTEAPSVRVSLNSGFSYWDLMHIASSLSPDFISAIAPFQLRSTVFHGHPRFYYAYDYLQIDNQVIEKRKPYQQYHIYTSYNDIIENGITTSSTNVRTNAVGHYVGPSWLSSEPKTVGPLFVDIDIFPEYQQSTSVNLNYEYKNSDIAPFTIPLADKIIDAFDWTSKPNGEKTAWRATANALKDCIKEMYQGELIILGDPSVKPFDKITIADTYEDISGSVEAEQVVHMFSVDTGFTTSITPDCISAIDNNYETMYNSINAQVIAPAIVADLMLIKSNIYFHTVNRPLYLSLSRMAKKGINMANTAIDSVLTAVGKEALDRETLALSSAMPEVVREFLMIDTKDIELIDMLNDLLKGKSVFNTTKVNGAKSFITILNDIDSMDNVLKSVSIDKYNDLVELLSDSRYSKTKVAELLKDTTKYTDAISGLTKSLTLSADDAATMLKALNDLDIDDAAVTAAKTILGNGKAVDLTTSEGKKVIKGLKAVGNYTDDFTSAAAPIAKIIGTKADETKATLKIIDGLSDVVSPAQVVKASKTLKGLLLNNIVTMAIDLVISKSAQEYLTKALRNLQVLTIYPLKKDGKVWTAGLNGHQGSVFGSLTYDEPGWLESLAIKFFDYGGEWGSNSSWSSGSKYLAILRDLFITTDEMRDIVNSYKRGNNYTIESHSDEKNATEAQVAIAENLATRDIQNYSDYRNIYYTKRLSMTDIQNKTEDAKVSYANYKIYSDDIEKDKTITDKLQCIISNSLVINNLYFKDCFKLAYDFNHNDVENNEKLGLTIKKIPIYNGGGAVQEVYAKKVGNFTPEVYDIPYLRSDAMILLHHVINEVLTEIQPDYELDTCKYEEISKYPFILHSATMVNSSEGWRSTGFLFTLEVKNYDNFSNIIKRIEDDRDNIVSSIMSGASPFTIVNEAANGYNKNTYTFFVHCPVS
nr:MAG TPA: hypothetical protein [Caudoviricetes sp.]